MKRTLIIVTAFLLFLPNLVAQNGAFITVWDLSINAGQEGRIQFRAELSGGPVNYEWYQISNPSVQGSGTLPSSGISGVDGLPSTEIRFFLSPQNLQRFSFTEGGIDERNRLIRVEQWGEVQWTSMENGFLNCSNLQVTATDSPNLSGVINMRRMFDGCSSMLGPANINDWDVSTVNNFSEMFRGASLFNRPLGNWQTNNATNMSRMFWGAASFNQPIGNWIVTNSTDMSGMLSNASSFNQNLGGWLFNGAANLSNFLSGSGLDCINYSSTLIGWGSNSAAPSGLTIDCDGLEYGTNALGARQNLLSISWTINGDIPRSEICMRTGDFITVWDLSISGIAPNSISFLVGAGGTVDYRWEHFDGTPGGSGTLANGVVTIPYLPVNQIIRLFLDPANLLRFSVNNNQDAPRLIDVEQWGDAGWNSMESAFFGCNNIQVSATDIPELTGVNNASNMFGGCSLLTGPNNIGTWDVSNISNFSYMFAGAANFNQPLSMWNTGNATNLSGMFAFASSFNQHIDNWNVANATTMYQMFNAAEVFNQNLNTWNVSALENASEMFFGATAFNGQLESWDVSNVTTMERMFYNATSFNQDIGSWDVPSITDFRGFLQGASSFNYPLANWTFNANAFLQNMLDNCGMNCENYSATLIGWEDNPNTPPSRQLGALDMEYNTQAQVSRNILEGMGWVISDDQLVEATLVHDPGTGGLDQTVCVDELIIPIEISFGGNATGFIYPNLPVGFSFELFGTNGVRLYGSTSQTGNFPFTFQTISNCDVATISGTISVIEGSVLSLVSGQLNQDICAGEAIQEIVFSFSGATNLVLSAGAPSWVNLVVDLSSQTATISGTPPSLATVYNFAIETDGGCGLAQSSITIGVENSPSIQLVAPSNDNQVVCINQPIRDILYLFDNVGEPNIVVSGLPNGIGYNIVASTLSISGAPTEVGLFVYNIQLNGCEPVTQIGTITADQSCVVSVPGGFSPNSDGYNDMWVVNAIELFPQNNLQVFNRIGTLVYEAAPYTNNWDGRPNRGSTTLGVGDKLPSGVYFYQLILAPGDTPMKGYVYISY